MARKPYKRVERFFTDEGGRRFRLLAKDVTVTVSEGHTIVLALRAYLKYDRIATTIWEKDKMPESVQKVIDEGNANAVRLIELFDDEKGYN